MVILVTGASGQLGQAIRFIASNYRECKFIFASSQDLDITNQDRVNHFFDTNKIDFCINTAAYTAVDKAESEIEKAESINVFGPKNLAIACSTAAISLMSVAPSQPRLIISATGKSENNCARVARCGFGLATNLAFAKS